MNLNKILSSQLINLYACALTADSTPSALIEITIYQNKIKNKKCRNVYPFYIVI